LVEQREPGRQPFYSPSEGEEGRNPSRGMSVLERLEEIVRCVCKGSVEVQTSKSFEGFEKKKLRWANILIRTAGLIVKEFVETKKRSRPLKD
jgi:hypothetical protein